jgi:hypothetical protein
MIVTAMIIAGWIIWATFTLSLPFSSLRKSCIWTIWFRRDFSEKKTKCSGYHRPLWRGSKELHLQKKVHLQTNGFMDTLYLSPPLPFRYIRYMQPSATSKTWARDAPPFTNPSDLHPTSIRLIFAGWIIWANGLLSPFHSPLRVGGNHVF